MSRRNRLSLIGIAAALAVFAADQASKYWILHGLDLPRRGDVKVLPHLDFTMVWNRGVTFGLLTASSVWSTAILAAVALAIVAALGVWLRRTDRVATALAIGAVAGGAVGNVLDRLRYGAVVDFIRAHAFGWSWYVFNVGDAAIVCGVAALALFGGGKAKQDAAADPG
ncbi:MAG: signal peptidase II [Rhodospirillales bacterium]|nr:signal peptidase II [Rhodospirillales bacterium]